MIIILLHLIICDSAIELLPANIASKLNNRGTSKKNPKTINEILLDRSYHHFYMRNLKNGEKRGRPDLIHSSILSATSTPLFMDNLLKVYIHTVNDEVIFLSDGVRLPKSYNRFVTLMAQLLKNKKIESDNEVLLELKHMSITDLISKINPDSVIALSKKGTSTNLLSLSKHLFTMTNPVVIVGGFPRGYFSNGVSSSFNELYSIHKYSLELHTVISRLVYSYECVLTDLL